MKFKVKKLNDYAIIPMRANPSDAGLDLSSVEDVIIPPLTRQAVSTGLAIELNPGMAGLIWPRSGLSVKHGLNTLAGVIDCSYRGEVKVVLHNTDPFESVAIVKGQRIAQLLIQFVCPCTAEEVAELSNTERGTNGFGSTGG